MKRATDKIKNRIATTATVTEMFFSLLMIPVGLTAAQGLEGIQNIEETLAFLLLSECLLLSLSCLLRAVARRYRNAIPERRRLDFIFSGMFFACAVGLFIWPYLPVMTLAGVVFMLSLIPGRVISMLRNRKWFNIVVNVAFILLVLFSMWDLWADQETQAMFVVVVMLLMACRGLLHIMSVTFAKSSGLLPNLMWSASMISRLPG